MREYQTRTDDRSQPAGSRLVQRERAEDETGSAQLDSPNQVAASISSGPTRDHMSLLKRVTAFGSQQTRSSILQLQRTHGNRYVQRALALAREGEGGGEVAPEVRSSIEASRGGGQAMDSGIRRRMESAFGSDFGGVRIHTGEGAHSLNRAVNAVAFTTGQDIFFREGAYSPDTSGGKELLAHELTHVVQQGGTAGVQEKLTLSQPSDQCEQEAERVAGEVTKTLDMDHFTNGGASDQSPGPQSDSAEVRQSGRELNSPPPRLVLKSLSVLPSAEADSDPKFRVSPDKSTEPGEEQDQSTSVTAFEATSNGVHIEADAVGLFSSPDIPDGFRWTQTINTNAPLHGATSPYVDPHPNDDDKPFYWTESETAAHPAFHDRPGRPTPAAGTTTWDAVLGLNGVNLATKSVQGFDYMSYGFEIDTSGTVTLHNGASVGGASHRSILASEFGAWTFS